MTEVDRMVQIGQIWTEQDQNGPNRMKVDCMDQIRPNGPNRTNVDRKD